MEVALAVPVLTVEDQLEHQLGRAEGAPVVDLFAALEAGAAQMKRLAADALALGWHVSVSHGPERLYLQREVRSKFGAMLAAARLYDAHERDNLNPLTWDGTDIDLYSEDGRCKERLGDMADFAD